MSASKTASQNQQVNAYYEYLEKQDKRSVEHFEKAKAQLLKGDEINEMIIKNQKRFELLLERWEKQTDKLDKVISNLENGKLGRP